ncbi:MAG: hypothetical protein EOO45_11775 [Flavobacterium sp.]|nr:MAG: hypothetical protein EOO45_11775 [Flavobacterium sp.]
MEPNKLEQDFKNKLNKREIQPTPMAWDRLDAMLTVAEKKKPKRTWMYIAASFLGFLLVATLFFRQQQNTDEVIINNDNTVVEQSAPTGKEVQPAIASPQEVTTYQDVKDTPAVIKKHEAVASTPVKEQKKAIEKKATSVKVNSTIAPLANEAVAATVEKESPKAETEMLLAAAGTGNDAKGKRTLVKVNSNSLLSSVEGELNESFRTKALQTVAKNYNAIKFRNHQ